MELPEEVKLFLIESYENLDQFEQEILNLESHPGDLETVNRLFRSIHTMKGNSGFLGYKRVETLCHRGETVLDRVRSKQLSFSQEIGSVILELVDILREILQAIERENQEPQVDTQAILKRLQSFLPT